MLSINLIENNNFSDFFYFLLPISFLLKKYCEFKKMGEWDSIFVELKNEIAGLHNKLYEYVYIRFF
jgi:hypothetical protein